MNKRSRHVLLASISTLIMILLTNFAHAEPQKLIIESGDSAQSRQRAEMERDQWRDTRTLRQKQNDRDEKEWHKRDAAIDNRYACETSENIQLYWESNTRRCLDRRTGRPAAP